MALAVAASASLPVRSGMSNFSTSSRWHSVRRRALILGGLAVIQACSAETPVAIRPGQQASGEVPKESNYSFSISPTDRSIRVRFARVRSDENESVSDFMRRMFAIADSVGATRLVIDVSSIRGGDAFLTVPLVAGVVRRERFVHRGGLVVIVGPDSFSPAQNAATLLERYANPIFESGKR
jgi:hypothetical protein